MHIIKNIKTYLSITVAALAALAVLVAVGGFQGTAEAGSDQPGLSLPYCESGSKSGQISMYWHTGNNAPAPDGWQVERTQLNPGQPLDQMVTKIFNFIGDDADALQTYGPRYWDWNDTSANTADRHRYRVRALDSDGNFMSGRIWSTRISEHCN